VGFEHYVAPDSSSCLHVSWLEALDLQIHGKSLNEWYYGYFTFLRVWISAMAKWDIKKIWCVRTEDRVSRANHKPWIPWDCPQICECPVNFIQKCQNEAQTGLSWAINFSLIAAVFSHWIFSYFPVHCSWYGLLWAETITSDHMCSFLTKRVPKLY